MIGEGILSMYLKGPGNHFRRAKYALLLNCHFNSLNHSDLLIYIINQPN